MSHLIAIPAPAPRLTLSPLFSLAAATQDGYTMEGTKKMGISAKKRNKILSTVREKALAASAKASAKIKVAAPAE